MPGKSRKFPCAHQIILWGILKGADVVIQRIPDRLWTLKEVAEFLRLAPRTVRRCVAYHRLPALRPMGKRGDLGFDPMAVYDWVRRQN